MDSTAFHIKKYLFGACSALFSYMAPIRSLVITAFVFVAVDFITGVWASYKRAKRSGVAWGFESAKAWDTVIKFVLIMGGIILAWMIEEQVLPEMDVKLANIFTGFVCGVEFWSYLENAAEISNHPVFRWLKKFMKKKISKQLDYELPEKEREQ